MDMKEVIYKFDRQIKEFANRKQEFCNCPGKDFFRNRKLDFESVIRSILSLDGGTLTNELLRIHKFSIGSPSASAFIQQRAKLFKKLNNAFDMDTRYGGIPPHRR